MLRTTLLHPQILEALGRAGHSSKILIADGNYPFATQLGPNATLVALNLSPGKVSATDVLEALVTAVPIEAATIMQPVTSGPYALKEDPPIWGSFRRILDEAGVDVPVEKLERFAFFDAAKDENVALTIATGEQRLYANLLLQIGVVFPDPKL
jgi:L-fucose mutarotase